MDHPENTQRLILETEVDGLKTEGFVFRRDFTQHERMIRASKMTGILWIVGLLTIVVPILHFILPPLFFIAGVVLGWTTWMESGEILEGEFTCPNCKHRMTFQREAEEWPKVQRCGGCSFTLKTFPAGHHAGQAGASDNHSTGNF